MCKPISVDSDGQGNIYCFPWELRRQIYAGELKNYDPDSHTSIADYHGFKGIAEDRLNKWEYDFETDTLTADRINTVDDLKAVKSWFKKVGLDYFYPPAEVAKIKVVHTNLYIPGISLDWANLTEVKGDVRDCKDCQFPVLTEVKGDAWATNCQFPVLTEVKGDVRATNCQFPVLTEVKGDVRATNCQFPVLTEVKGHVWDCKDCQFPVLTEVKGDAWATNCQFPVLTEVKGHVRATNCQFPVLTEVKGHVHATNCQFPVLTEVKGHVWDCKDCQFPVLTEVKGDAWATNCQFPVLKKINGRPYKNRK